MSLTGNVFIKSLNFSSHQGLGVSSKLRSLLFFLHDATFFTAYHTTFPCNQEISVWLNYYMRLWSEVGSNSSKVAKIYNLVLGNKVLYVT